MCFNKTRQACIYGAVAEKHRDKWEYTLKNRLLDLLKCNCKATLHFL